MSWFSNITQAATKLFEWLKSNNDRKKDIIDYRLSDDAINQAKIQENREFNRSLESGNTRVSDAIRKNKQKKINRLKRRIDQ